MLTSYVVASEKNTVISSSVETKRRTMGDDDSFFLATDILPLHPSR